MWHKVNFKQSKAGLNGEFSFSLIDCLAKAEKPSLANYLTITRREKRCIQAFPKGIGTKGSANNNNHYAKQVSIVS